MRQLLPQVRDSVDLEAAYAVPAAGRRHVRANFVTSADGAAELRGRSHPLSNPADKTVFAVLRDLTDVVLVGAGTARVEGYGPVETSAARQRWRVERDLAPVPPIAVVTRRLDLDLHAPLFTSEVVRPILLTTEQAPLAVRQRAAEVADVVLCGEFDVDLAVGLDALADRGLHRVLCEGGPELLGHLLAAARLDELCLTIAPLLAGSAHARMVSGPVLPAALRLRIGHLLEDDDALFLRYVRVSGA